VDVPDDSMPVDISGDDNDSEATGFPVIGDAGCGSVDGFQAIWRRAPAGGSAAAAALMRPMKPAELKAIKITNLFDLETLAEKALPAGGFGYIWRVGRQLDALRERGCVRPHPHRAAVAVRANANVDLTVDILDRG